MKTILSIDVQMTWKQAFYYASESGYLIWILLALVLLAAAAIVLLVSKSQFRIILAGVLLMAAAASFYFKPGSIKFNNEFKMEQGSFDYYKNQSETFDTFFDSLYKANRLKWAANPEYKK